MAMKDYNYYARTGLGKAVHGKVQAKDRTDLDRFFTESKLIPIEIREESGSSFSLRWKKRVVSESELIVFARQFASAYAAGIPVASIIKILSGQTENKKFRVILDQIVGRLEQGTGLTESFTPHEDVFDHAFLSILHSGEVSGNLDVVLDYAAGLLEKRVLHRERIRSAFLYPKLVLGMMVVTVLVIMTYVVPQFVKLYDKFQAELPLPTRLLITSSQLFQQYAWCLVLVVPAVFFLMRYLKTNRAFMLTFHEKCLAIPILGKAMVRIELAQFCTLFALLIRAGIKITDAAGIAIEGLHNSYLKNKFAVIIPALEKGASLSSALTSSIELPVLVISMIRIGEETGKIDSLLDRVAVLYDNETDLFLKKLPTLLEPIILSLLFGLVLFLALAIYLPMWKMASFARPH